MMKTRLTLIAAVVALISFSVSAEEPKITLSSKWSSEYLLATGVVVHDRPVLQTDFNIALENGIYFDIWHSIGLNDDDWSSDGGDEVDWTIGWKGKIGQFDFNLAAAYFDTTIDDLFTPFRGDLFRPSIEVSKNFECGSCTIRPFGKAMLFLPLDGPLPERGIAGVIGLDHTWKLTEKFAISNRLGLIFDDGVLGQDSGMLAEFATGLSWKLSDSKTLDILSIRTITPINAHDSRDTETVFGFGFTFRF